MRDPDVGAGFAVHQDGAQQVGAYKRGNKEQPKTKEAEMKAGRNFIVGLSWLVVMGVGVMAQAPDTLWTRTYGGAGHESARAVEQTPDGGYLIAGYTDSFGYGDWDFYLIRTDSNGDTLWTKTYGGIQQDVALSMDITQDGGCIIAGYTFSFGNMLLVYVVKTDFEGDTLWTRIYGNNTQQEALHIEQTTDGGYIIAGHTSYGGAQSFLIKTDSLGNEEWSRISDPPDNSYCYSVQQTPDGGYITGGWVYSYWDSAGYPSLTKLDDMGDSVWCAVAFIPSTWRSPGEVRDVLVTSDSEYVAVGYLKSGWFPYYHYTFCIQKFNRDGVPSWSYGHQTSSRGYAVDQTLDGGYIAAGCTTEVIYAGGESAVLLIRTNYDGDTLWTKIIGGVEYAFASDVKQTTDGGYIVAGSTTSSSGAIADFYIIKTERDPCIDVPRHDIVTIPDCFLFHTPYPNPFNSSTNISYEVPIRSKVKMNVYNILGQEVATVVEGVVNPGSYSVVWEAKELSSGIYFVNMQAQGFRKTQKVVLLK
jgi:hypothetical protein